MTIEFLQEQRAKLEKQWLRLTAECEAIPAAETNSLRAAALRASVRACERSLELTYAQFEKVKKS